MNLIHAVIDAFVHRLHASIYIDLTCQLLRLVFACIALELRDQLVGFLLCDESGGLHRIYEKLQLDKLELPACNLIMVGLAILHAYDIQTKRTQILDVTVQALPLCCDIVCFQFLNDFIQCQVMIFVCLFEQNLHQIHDF